MKLVFLLICTFIFSCKSAKNTNPCNTDAKIIKKKLTHNPDSEAFHLECYVYEKDGSPSNRRVFIYSEKRPVSRHKNGNEYYTIEYLFEGGILPSFRIGKSGYFDLDFLNEGIIYLAIKPFNKIKINSKLGESQKIIIHLEDITFKDCFDYIQEYQKVNGIEIP